MHDCFCSSCSPKQTLTQKQQSTTYASLFICSIEDRIHSKAYNRTVHVMMYTYTIWIYYKVNTTQHMLEKKLIICKRTRLLYCRGLIYQPWISEFTPTKKKRWTLFPNEYLRHNLLTTISLNTNFQMIHNTNKRQRNMNLIFFNSEDSFETLIIITYQLRVKWDIKKK